MQDITTITIIVSIATLFLSIVSPMFNALFRAPEHRKNTPEQNEDNTVSDGENLEDNAYNTETIIGNNPISIVIIAHDNARASRHEDG